VSIGDAIDVPVPRRLRQMLTLGELGRKSGRGFYDYN
jgi:3-hydroxyacyl-CoA dehydrogenase